MFGEYSQGRKCGGGGGGSPSPGEKIVGLKISAVSVVGLKIMYRRLN